METSAKSILSPSPKNDPSSSLESIQASEVRKRLDHIYGLTGERYLKEFLKEIENAKELPFNLVNNILMAIFRDYRLREAYSLLYELNYKRFIHIIYRKTKFYSHRLDPWDILQDVFLSIYRYPKRFQEGKPYAFKNWSFSIIRNTILIHLKKRGNYETDSEARLETMEDKNALNPLSNMVQKEGIKKFQKLYIYYLIIYLNIFNNFLSFRERKVLQLVEVEDKRYSEASEIMGIKLENFKMVVFRARKKILKLMNQMLGEDPCKIKPCREPHSVHILERTA
jgi:RNA polymerase sigma factor (sigma-70 family)